MTKLAVAGGTGLIGTMIVDAARGAGWEPVVLARSTGVDLVTGAGLDAALGGVDTVIDVSNIATPNRRRAVDFFGTAAQNLLRAEEFARVRHHLCLSIVGIDRVDTGYYAGKRRQEEVVTGGSVPWTILRSTQFHEFPGLYLHVLPGPVAVVPRQLSRPVAAREVAEHLVELAGGPAIGCAPEIAGPEERRMADLVRRLARARHSRRAVLELPPVGAAAIAAARGALLPAGPGPRGTETFEQWLDRVVREPNPSPVGGRS